MVLKTTDYKFQNYHTHISISIYIYIYIVMKAVHGGDEGVGTARRMRPRAGSSEVRGKSLGSSGGATPSNWVAGGVR